jgi:hypothetical protein
MASGSAAARSAGLRSVRATASLLALALLQACGGGGPAKHEVAGLVTGPGAAGTTIALSGEAEGEVDADEEGRFRFSALEDGRYDLTPRHAGFTLSPASVQVTVRGASVVDIRFASTPVLHAISGLVTGAGAAGVKITLSGAGSAEAVTDDLGAFSFAGLADGQYSVRPSREGLRFDPEERSVTVRGGDVTAVTFLASPALHTIAGTVVGDGAVGTEIALSGAATSATTVDALGAFRFADLPDGAYRLTPAHAGYAFTPAGRDVELRGEDVTGADFASERARYTVAGTLAGPGAAGAWVTLWPLVGTGFATTTADAAGTFRLEGVLEGVYQVSPGHTGFTFTPQSRTVVVEGGDLTEVTFDSEYATYTLNGGLTGPGAAGATVSLAGDATATTTADATGRYAFNGLRDGHYEVSPSRPGFTFTPASRSVDIHGEGMGGVDFSSVLTVHLVSGLIVGPCAAGTPVRFTGPTSASATTGGDGRFTVSVPDGTYVATPERWGCLFTPPSQQVVVSGGEVTGVSFGSALATARVAGTVTGPGAAGATMTLSGAATYSTMTDGAGAFAFDGIPWGAYRLTPSRDGFVFTPPRQDVGVSGPVTNLSFGSTVATYSISGTVTGPDAGWTTLVLSGPQSGSVHADWTRGRYQLTGLHPGVYTVTASKAGSGFTPRSRTVDLTRSDAAGVDFVAAPARGWHYESPLPQGNYMLGDVWGTGPDDVWAVGSGEAILHWDGASWTSVDCGGHTMASADTIFMSVHGVDGEVWVVGDHSGRVVHWDGSAWTSVTVPDSGAWLYAVRAFSRTDVWTAGHNDAMLHWDGVAWNRVSRPGTATIYGLWGAAPDDLWAVGGGGTILHWDGAAWSAVASGTAQSLYDVWGNAPDDIWAVGDAGTLLHWDGAAWRPVELGLTITLGHVWGASSSDLWVTGEGTTGGATFLHWDGFTWVAWETDAALGAIWGAAPDDMWAVGSWGAMVRWDGERLDPYSSSVTSEWLLGTWGVSPDDVWVTGRGGALLHRVGATWTAVPSGTTANLWDVWGSGADDVWAVGDGIILHWDGQRWVEVPHHLDAELVDAQGLYFRDAWGSAPDDVWIVGYIETWNPYDRYHPVTLHWDGASWTKVPNDAAGTLIGIWGSSAHDVWAVGGYVLIHWDGTAWTSFSAGTPQPLLYGVWGASPTDVYASGFGEVRHWDGHAWTRVYTGGGTWRRIWGSSGSDVWTVSELGAMAHWNGMGWTGVWSGSDDTLFDVYGWASNDVLAVGLFGGMLRYGP